MYVSEDEKDYAVSLNLALRMNGFISDMEYMSRNLKGQFKQADRFNAKFLIILNSEDIVLLQSFLQGLAYLHIVSF